MLHTESTWPGRRLSSSQCGFWFRRRGKSAAGADLPLRNGRSAWLRPAFTPKGKDVSRHYELLRGDSRYSVGPDQSSWDRKSGTPNEALRSTVRFAAETSAEKAASPTRDGVASSSWDVGDPSTLSGSNTR